MEEKVTAQLCEFKPEYFPTLGAKELLIIERRIKALASLCFHLSGKKDFYAIIDLDGDSVHLRRVGGPVAWQWKYLEQLCLVIAHKLDVKKLTVIADQKFIRFAIKRMGYKKVDGYLYEKVIA